MRGAMRGVLIGSERIDTTFRGTQDHVLNVSRPRSERIETTFRTYRHHVPNVSRPRPERIDTTFRGTQDHVLNVSQPRSERITTTSPTYSNTFLTNYSPQKQKPRCRSKWTDN